MGMFNGALKSSSPAALSLPQGHLFMPALNEGEEAVLYCSSSFFWRPLVEALGVWMRAVLANENS